VKWITGLWFGVGIVAIIAILGAIFYGAKTPSGATIQIPMSSRHGAWPWGSAGLLAHHRPQNKIVLSILKFIKTMRKFINLLVV